MVFHHHCCRELLLAPLQTGQPDQSSPHGRFSWFIFRTTCKFYSPYISSNRLWVEINHTCRQQKRNYWNSNTIITAKGQYGARGRGMDIPKCHLCLLQPSHCTINTHWHFIVSLTCHERILLLKVCALLDAGCQHKWLRKHPNELHGHI